MPFSRIQPAALLIAARLTFTTACLVVGYGVFKPPGHAPPLMPWDKAEHFTAFFGMMGLALVAFPRTPPWILAASLSFAGAAIEVIQATPLIHRDADVMDWAADTIGILAIVGTVIAARLRRSLTGWTQGAEGALR
jgi:VanZ family protein